MSGDKNSGNKPVLSQVADAIKKGRREKLKASLKTDIEAFLKADEARTAVLENIAAKLEAAGESPEGVAEILEGL